MSIRKIRGFYLVKASVASVPVDSAAPSTGLPKTNKIREFGDFGVKNENDQL